MDQALDAIVVGSVDLGEADRIVRLLSAVEGRVSVVARGARSSRRRFAGVTELGTQVQVVRGRGRGLVPAIAMERVDGPNRARSDLDRIALLAYGCELCASLAPEGAPAERLYLLLVHWLSRLEDEPLPDDACRVALEAKALTFAGLCPALLRCACCGEPLTDPVVFDAEAGGGQHARCGGGRPVRAEALQQIDVLRRTPLVDCRGLPLVPEVRWLCADFAQHQLGRALTSRAWFASLG